MRSLSQCSSSISCRWRFWYNFRRLYSSKPANVPSTSSLLKPRLDYRAIAENIVSKSQNAINRKAPIPMDAVHSVSRTYNEQKELSGILNAKRNARSVIGERIRAASGRKDDTGRNIAMEEAKSLKSEVTNLESKLAEIEDKLLQLALGIPNDTHPLSPLGPESAAKLLSSHGPAPISTSANRDHVAVGRALGLLDFESAAATTGSSWYYLLGSAAMLEIALINYALTIAIKHGYTPVVTPDVVRSDIASRCGFQPRDQADPPVSQMYHISQVVEDPSSVHHHPELVLSGTAEIPLAGIFANKILSPSALPTKLVGVGRSFRAEAGARGADTRGLYRVHQFTKVELFAVSSAENGASEDMMEEIKRLQIEIFEGLGFPFRVLDMPTEELGASAYRKYDMEAWMPGRGSWGEISSTSNCTDYQSRRLHIRYRSPTPSAPSNTSSASTQQQYGLPFAHTLNGTAAAIPRLIVTLFENGAQFDEAGVVIGIDLPKVLRPFWVGGDVSGIIRWV